MVPSTHVGWLTTVLALALLDPAPSSGLQKHLFHRNKPTHTIHTKSHPQRIQISTVRDWRNPVPTAEAGINGVPSQPYQQDSVLRVHKGFKRQTGGDGGRNLRIDSSVSNSWLETGTDQESPPAALLSVFVESGSQSCGPAQSLGSFLSQPRESWNYRAGVPLS